jgi:hypothetical protein
MTRRRDRGNTTVISGDRNIAGDKNRVNSPGDERYEQHIHHHRHEAARGKPTSGDDAIGMLVGAGIALMTVVWFFFKNSTQVYYYVKLASLLSVVLVVVCVSIAFFWPAREGASPRDTIIGIVLGIIVFGVTLYCESKVDSEIVKLAQASANGVQFWRQLTEFGQRLAVETLLTAFFLVLAAAFALLGSFRLIALSGLGARDFDYWLTRKLFPFRPSRGSIVGLVAIVAAFALASGVLFDLIDATRARRM